MTTTMELYTRELVEKAWFCKIWQRIEKKNLYSKMAYCNLGKITSNGT